MFLKRKGVLSVAPKFKFTREEIIQAALELTREKGSSALTARGVAGKLGSSPKPIFGLFQSMEELQQEVLAAASATYQSYIEAEIKERRFPAYKSSGMAYIRFAKEERELFKLLFMRDRSQEAVTDGKEELRPLLKLIQESTGLSEEQAFLFHVEMWIYVHGIATMLVTNYLDWDMEFISQVLTDAYVGLKYRYCTEEGKAQL